MDKKKKLAVRILAGFFIAMAVCTIIARAAASLMVAQVNVDKVRRGRLTYSYTGSGKIVPEKEEQIFLWPGQQVEKAAKEGSTVKRGECLVQFRGEYLLKTIEQKQSEVEQLKLRREQQLISTRETQRVPASASAALALNSAEDRLAQAWQKEADAQYAYDSEESEELKQQLYQEVQSAQAEAASLEQAVTDAQNAYDLACQQDAAQEENDANAREAAELGIKDLDIQIRQAEEELKKLQEYQAADGKIYAEKTCVILKSGVQEGSISTGTEVLTVGNSGWRLQGTAGSEEKEVLAAGLQVEIETSSSEKYKVEIESNADAGGDPAAEVIFWSASLPDGMVAAYNETFIWKAEIETEEEFDQIIPQSALREGASGYYCLVLSEETGMLGTVQAAKKVNVNVIKKDGEKAAVEGGLKRDSQIIVSSDKYVEEGDQVRIKENEN